jgi:hypothetical protein
MATKRKSAVAIARLREAAEARLAAIQDEIQRERDGLGAIETRFDMKEIHAAARTMREVLELERRERQYRERRGKQRKVVNDARRLKLAQRIAALGQEPDSAADRRETGADQSG